MRGRPQIEVVDGPAGRRARLAGTGLDVQEAVETLIDNGGSARAAAEYHGLPVALMEAAADYYAAHTAEIDAEIAENLAAHARIGGREA